MTLTVSELGSLGSRGWYGTHAPPSTFHKGVAFLGGGAAARIRMQLIWAQERPAGFWASTRGRAWKKVTGNLTWPVFRALLAEIQAYEDRVGIPASHRMTRAPIRAPRRPARRPVRRVVRRAPTTLQSSVARARATTVPVRRTMAAAVSIQATQARPGIVAGRTAPRPVFYSSAM